MADGVDSNSGVKRKTVPFNTQFLVDTKVKLCPSLIFKNRYFFQFTFKRKHYWMKNVHIVCDLTLLTIFLAIWSRNIRDVIYLLFSTWHYSVCKRRHASEITHLCKYICKLWKTFKIPVFKLMKLLFSLRILDFMIRA